MSLAPSPTRAQQWTAQNLLLEQELGRLARAFGEARIPLGVLKGVPLTRRLHASLAGRFSIDNDLLVRREHVHAARALLTQLGYVPKPGRLLDDDLLTTFQHPMQRELAGTVWRAELHWHAFPPHLFRVPEQLLWQHMTTYQLADTQVQVFDEAMTLLHLASHYVQHRCSEQKVLRDVAQAWQTWRGNIDRSELVALSRACGLDAALAYSLATAVQSGACSDAERPVASARAALVARFMPPPGQTAEPSYRAMFGSLLLAGPSRVPGAFLHELFPPLPVLSRIYGSRPSRLLYLRYPLRLLRPLAGGRWARRRDPA